MRGWVLSRVLGLGAVVAVAGACEVAVDSGAGGSGARSAAGGVAHAAALRERFPALAPEVLEAEEAFVASPEGFTLRPPEGTGTWRSVQITLPPSSADPIRLRVPGFEARVREIGATGETALAEHGAAHARAGGSSFWAAAPGAVEEWLHLGRGIARDGEVAAAWEVEGGTLRRAGEAVEIVDDAGIPRVRVTAPRAYAVGGRPVTARLGVEGARIELFVDAGGDEVLVDPSWTATSTMIGRREFHTATRLANGKVLVVGGRSDGTTWLSSAETYDPTTGTWSAAASMANTRLGHAAVLLASGKVLVTGGGAASQTAEVYDPAANTWSPAATMMATRGYHTATLLPSGKVLVAGGGYNNPELYDPSANTWTPAGSMTRPDRYWASATLLTNGKVLVAGGMRLSSPGGNLAVAELYDPATNTWSAAASMASARQGQAATLLPSGKVLLAGGSLQVGEVYDPGTNAWQSTPAMSTVRQYPSANLLANGRVLVVGYYNPELYDPSTNSWSAAPATSTPYRNAHTGTLLTSGQVLVAGGTGTSTPTTAASELFSLLSGNGASCALGTDCGSGFCVDGVCCNTACSGGTSDCQACSVAAGAAVSGTCGPTTGNGCNDGNACTTSDTCQAGTCTGANPVVCAAPDQCHTVGTCNTATGACSNPAKANGSACDDGNPGTTGDVCTAGVCAGIDRCAGVVCAAQDPCHTAGTCDSLTGTCSNPAAPNGTACNDGDACTQTDTCQAGVCTGAASVTCSASDACHTAGTCDPLTGACSNPAKPDGSACNDGDACTQTDTCQAGVCTGQSPVTCAPQDSCHLAGTCDPLTGACSNPPNPACSPTCITLQRGVLGNAYDALINAASPAKNYGTTQSLTASTGSAGLRYGLLRFDLSPIPAGATITSATLRLTVMLTGGAGPLALHRVTAPWSETTVTWASFAGAFSANVEAALPAVALPTADLQALVQAWVSGASANHGVLLERTADGSTILASSEFIPSQQPRLDVCYLP